MSSVREGLIASAELILPRRGFLGLLCGAVVTPAIIKTGILMPIKVQPRPLILPSSASSLRPRMMWWDDKTDRWVMEGLPIQADLPPLYANNHADDPVEWHHAEWPILQPLTT
jgi:hypothetical protein